MKKLLSRRGKIRALTFLAAAFAVLCGVAIRLAASNIHYRRAAALSYARAFSQLTDSIDKLDAALEKSVYVTSSNMIAALCTEVYGEALTAQQAIGELPYANIELEQTAAFVAKTGDYAQALARSAARNGGYSGDELEMVKQLSQAASALSGQLDEWAWYPSFLAHGAFAFLPPIKARRDFLPGTPVKDSARRAIQMQRP